MRAGDLVELRHPLVPSDPIRVVPVTYDIDSVWSGGGGRYSPGTLAIVLEVHDTHVLEGHSMESYAMIMIEGKRGYVYCHECRVVGRQSDATG